MLKARGLRNNAIYLGIYLLKQIISHRGLFDGGFNNYKNLVKIVKTIGKTVVKTNDKCI